MDYKNIKTPQEILKILRGGIQEEQYCDLIYKRLYNGNHPLDKKEFELMS